MWAMPWQAEREALGGDNRDAIHARATDLMGRAYEAVQAGEIPLLTRP